MEMFPLGIRLPQHEGARKERFCCVGARPGGIVRGKDARVSRLDGESPMRIECEMKVECPEAPFPGVSKEKIC